MSLPAPARHGFGPPARRLLGHRPASGSPGPDRPESFSRRRSSPGLLTDRDMPAPANAGELPGPPPGGSPGRLPGGRSGRSGRSGSRPERPRPFGRRQSLPGSLTGDRRAYPSRRAPTHAPARRGSQPPPGETQLDLRLFRHGRTRPLGRCPASLSAPAGRCLPAHEPPPASSAVRPLPAPRATGRALLRRCRRPDPDRRPIRASPTAGPAAPQLTRCPADRS